MEISRRKFLKSTAALAAITVSGSGMLLLEGCPLSQSQLTQLVGEVGTGLSGIVPYLKSVNTTITDNIEASFSALQQVVSTWKPGTVVTDIEQAVNAFVANMALIPVVASYQPLVALIVATAEGIITLLVPNAAPPATSAGRALAIDAKHDFPKPPRTKGEFRSKWNGIVKADPKLGGLQIA